MRQNCLMDIGEKSSAIGHTPALFAQRLPFYVHSAGHFYAKDGYFTERDGVDNYLLFYTLSGSGMLKYGGNESIIGPNQAALIYCGEYHFYKTADDNSIWDFKWLHFNGTAIKEYFQMINTPIAEPINISGEFEINKLFNLLAQAAGQKDILADVKISSYITDIMCGLVTSKISPINNSKFDQHKSEIDSVIEFIKDNFDKKIGVDDFAKLIMTSKFHFLRLFKAYTGTSPYEYLMNFRINKSKQLLNESTSSVNEVALMVGFSDANNYIRYFKKVVGTTPAKYRQSWM